MATFEQAIRANFGSDAKFLDSVEVAEGFEGQLVWEGTISVFELLDGPKAGTKCYAWVHFMDVDHTKIMTVLNEGPIDSAEKAVQVSLEKEFRDKEGASD